MESRLSWVDKKLKLYVLLKLSIITDGPLSFHRKLKESFWFSVIQLMIPTLSIASMFQKLAPCQLGLSSLVLLSWKSRKLLWVSKGCLWLQHGPVSRSTLRRVCTRWWFVLLSTCSYIHHLCCKALSFLYSRITSLEQPGLLPVLFDEVHI